MKKINLIDSPILKDLLVLSIQNQCVDLHNDFDCQEVIAHKRLIFTFSNPSEKLYLVFSDYQIIEQALPFDPAYSQTLDSFYRGRYQNGKLWDQYQGKQCFYLDFIENQKLCLLAKNAYFCQF
jgi:hypothetical protein